ncbi:insulin-like growth factor-binding protein complex acid labile subunit [Liolophura sinensis]|uniref:insulin-like growth factor-binding protein complex acid labile subunit n=1 Tax=Liolophura sinensis TaxID=3198878 RepID=UPI0031591A96
MRNKQKSNDMLLLFRMSVKVFVLLLFYGLAWAAKRKEIIPPRNLTENCPRQCFCSKTLTSVNCAGKGLTELPPGIPTKVVKLFLDHNKLSTIPSLSFKGLKSLVYLDLKSNEISSLPENAFTGAVSLTKLFLTTNMITDIDTEAFEGLSNLQFLNLGANKVHGLFDLGYVPNLQQLVLQGNQLVSVTFPEEAKDLKTLYDITLTSNHITNLTSLSFLALENSRVKRLDLARNDISHISTESFVPLTELQSLKIGFNPLNTEALIQGFAGIRSNTLASLDMSGVALSGDLPAAIFKAFGNVMLRNLNLNHNNIGHLDDGNFQYLGRLMTLDLRTCKIQTVSDQAFSGLNVLNQLQLQDNLLSKVPKNLPQSLQKLYLDRNNIVTLHKSDFEGLKSLTELHLGYNTIVRLETQSFVGLSNLKKLYLTGNKIATLPGLVFKPLQKLISLELNRNNLQQIPNESEVFSVMSSLTYLNLADNFCKSIPLNLFTGMTELLYLHLENNYLGSVIESDSSGQLFRALPKLQELFLASNDIGQLPESIFRTLASVLSIKLQDNKISQWKENTFSITKKLETLDVSNNLISLLNETSLKDLKKLKNLNLTGNPFSCDCDTRWFRDWLNRTHVGLPMVNSYKCNSPPSWQGKPLLRFNRTLIDCTNKTPYYISGGLGAGVLVTFFVLVVAYRYRWFIKLRAHKARVAVQRLMKRQGYQQIPGDNHEFDAYVSYTEADKRWVLDYLLPKFDNGRVPVHGIEFQGNYKLCVDERDFIPGEASVGNIDTCMRNSRKILVVLSRSYLRDSKSDFEMRHAFHIVNIEQDAEELLIIKKGRLRIKDIPKVVHPMIQKREYLEWPDDDEDGQQDFETQLSQRLGERRQPNFLEI